MRYPHSAAQSTEYLRLALQRMTQQNAVLHPVNYAVWYEYVSGLNPDLKAAVDTLLRDGGRLDDEASYVLHARHIAGLSAESALRIGNSVSSLVDCVSESARQAGDQASEFDSSLRRWGDSLAQPSAKAAEQAPGLADILSGTRQMQQAISTLQQRLAASTQEAQQLRQEVARAREEALLDGLTGLANRKGFDLALAASLEEACHDVSGPCLLMIDLDWFKRLNDTHGHVFGDKVLVSVATILKANVKGKDTAARFGGEEFAVILPRTPRGGAIGLAEALRALVASSRIRQVGKNDSWIGNITVSIGVADHLAGESALELVARADRALYAAKAQGRNRVSLAPRPQAQPAR
ncbi:GGDEF domain-containing protein [Accumulibacter sp.]|uniref:GGDEF domain-containing protein n=1 Tax=Accumulibacter sp. TaxID=2053492 RepID=UPI002638ECAF|nr:GGDEF domain-containing protein [Accumulibacter sp.]